MAATAEIVCPECDENLRVPESVFGKRVKCKHCGHAFVVKKPAAKPAAKPADSPPALTPEEAKRKRLLDDDDENIQIELIAGDDEIPRCPHCAKELDPPDAVVCVNCGFNNVTRAAASTKKVWAPSAEDWIMHLLPGILAASICIGLIVWNIICYMNMREWMTGSFLDQDELDAAGRKKFYVAPGFFICLSVVFSILAFIPCVKLAFRRFYLEFRPPEQLKV
ncbi:MAG TPA: hypothetical protein VLM40_05710 [Gemmata sp.]|nr:hypothetical protein [Gemmata sp.]